MTKLAKALRLVADHMEEQLPTGTIQGVAITESVADHAIIKAFRRLATVLENCPPEAADGD